MAVIDGVTTGRCSVDFFRGGSKVNHNIGIFDIGHWENRVVIWVIPLPKPPSMYLTVRQAKTVFG